MNQNFISS